jgi:hypothetical protein
MSVIGFIKSYWRRAALWRLEKRLAREKPALSVEPSNWHTSISEPTTFYFECLRYFYQQLPREIREHRSYFHNVPSNRRGFGENPFHVMWYLLFRQYRPTNFLEIGVFRGQTISLAALCARLDQIPCQIYGVSPFSNAGDSVSNYSSGLDYYQDTLNNFDFFKLPHPHLVRAYSTQSEALSVIRAHAWDMIYIDGNHDYEVAHNDWQNCSQNLRPGGLIVLDDSALLTSFKPPVFAASRGHPGPSQVAKEINPAAFREILQVGHNRVFQKIA